MSGLPAIRKIGFFKFIFGTVWKPTAQSPLYGILPFILGSVWSTIGAIILGVPVGIMCAVFIAKFAPKRVRAVLKGAVELLAGIPSIIYGLFGMLIFVNFFSLGTSLVAGSLTLVIMTLPTIIRTVQESLKTVPAQRSQWHCICTQRSGASSA